MINPYNVSEVLSDLIFNQFGFHVSPSVTPEERNIADNLYNSLIAILESNSYFFESKTTLDHDDDFCNVNFEDFESPVTIYEQNNDSADIGSQPVDEHDLEKAFYFDYMKRVVACFDEKDTSTGRRKRNWCTIKHVFRRVPNPQYISRFRKYVNSGGTKRQKIDDIDIFVYDEFENARQQFLCVHDIDLRRWLSRKLVN